MKQKVAFGFQVFSILILIISVFFSYLVREEKNLSEIEVRGEQKISSSLLNSAITYVMVESMEGKIKY